MALKHNELPTLHVLWHYDNIENINAFTADVKNAMPELNRRIEKLFLPETLT